MSLVTLDFNTVLDIGAGKCEQATFLREFNKEVFTCDYGEGTNSLKLGSYDYIGDFNHLTFRENFDCTLCSHILEHQLNINSFYQLLRLFYLMG